MEVIDDSQSIFVELEQQFSYKQGVSINYVIHW